MQAATARCKTSLELAIVRPQYLLKCGLKAKKTKNIPKSVPVTEKVLEYFDLYYRPAFKKLWPSIRISLLSSKKPAAVINNFASNNHKQESLLEKGAYDVIQLAKQRQSEVIGSERKVFEFSDRMDDGSLTDSENNTTEVLDTYKTDLETNLIEKAKNELPIDVLETLRKDLDVFVTDKKLYYDAPRIENVFSEITKDRNYPYDGKFTDKRTEYTALNNKVDIVKASPLSIPENLKLLTFQPGDLTSFPAVRGDSQGLLNYYIIDGASLLPVIALDLEEGDTVLDLCASPGGKTITILQTGLPASLHCNDISHSRTEKLKTFLNFCVPREKQAYVDVTTSNGTDFVTPRYNKVLVDVPCNTDRHFLLTKENNLFSKDRARERLELPQTQRDLLVSGIKSCLPGGHIVYSTCTLAPGQNDGTVQQALDEILQTTDIQVVVEDLQEIVDVFRDTFKFYHGCRFGKLVIPSLLSNFGPMYFARLQRLN